MPATTFLVIERRQWLSALLRALAMDLPAQVRRCSTPAELAEALSNTRAPWVVVDATANDAAALAPLMRSCTARGLMVYVVARELSLTDLENLVGAPLPVPLPHDLALRHWRQMVKRMVALSQTHFAETG